MSKLGILVLLDGLMVNWTAIWYHIRDIVICVSLFFCCEFFV